MKTCIFDLDGTLLDTLGDIKAALNYSLMAHHIKEATTDDTRRYVGSGLRNAVNRALSEKAKAPVSDEVREDVYQMLVRYYQMHPAVFTRPYKGISELLLDLQAAGVKVAVLTNKDHSITEPLLKVLLPQVRFLFIHGKKDNTPLKPSAGLTNSLLEEWGLRRSETVIIGDSDVDFLTAENAGLRSFIVSYGFRTDRELKKIGVRKTYRTVDELRAALMKEINI